MYNIVNIHSVNKELFYDHNFIRIEAILLQISRPTRQDQQPRSVIIYML